VTIASNALRSGEKIDEIVDGTTALRRYVEKEQESQGDVRVRMGRPLVEGDRVVAEFWVHAGDDASIAGSTGSTSRVDARHSKAGAFDPFSSLIDGNLAGHRRGRES
jgi:hypothetical protein